MDDNAAVEFDEIGYWSEVKLEIVRSYAAEYSKILTAQTSPDIHHVYIDAFAGPGVNISKATGDFIAGSPLNALKIEPPFREFFLIDNKCRKSCRFARNRWQQAGCPHLSGRLQPYPD